MEATIIIGMAIVGWYVPEYFTLVGGGNARALIGMNIVNAIGGALIGTFIAFN